MRRFLEHPGVGNGSRYISAATDSTGLMATHELQAMLAGQFPQLDVGGEEKNEDGGYPETPSIMETYSTLAIESLGLRTRSIEETVRATGEAYLELGLIGSAPASRSCSRCGGMHQRWPCPRCSVLPVLVPPTQHACRRLPVALFD